MVWMFAMFGCLYNQPNSRKWVGQTLGLWNSWIISNIIKFSLGYLGGRDTPSFDTHKHSTGLNSSACMQCWYTFTLIPDLEKSETHKDQILKCDCIGV